MKSTFRVLYAAYQHTDAYIQLERFIWAIQDLPIHVRVAAYNTPPKHVCVDWSLNCLDRYHQFGDVFNRNINHLDYYHNQVKRFKPHLIISDLEPISTWVGLDLKIPVWQCSSGLLRQGIHYGQQINSFNILTRRQTFFKKIEDNFSIPGKRGFQFKHLLDKSDKLGIYSHFGDTNQILIKKNYQWIRPYHSIGNISLPCHHNIVACLLSNNKRTMSCLQYNYDTVAFNYVWNERYENVNLKSLHERDEYYCNLKNCNTFVCEGEASFLADAYYNGKFSGIYTNFDDPFSTLSGEITENLKLGFQAYGQDDIENAISFHVKPKYSPKISYLHQHILDVI